MIDLLGKRPFVGRSDDMDKWLDENRGGKSAPPPLEDAPQLPSTDESIPPAPAPAFKKLDNKAML
jgi:AFG3 family protein